MAQSQIKWKKGDYISLGKAVAEFNKKINKLQREEDLAYLPAKIDYKEAKENIATRKELNRLINSLKRFQREGAEELYETEAGEEMTVWERKELGIQSRIAQTRLKQELAKLNEPLESGFSRAEMGSERVKEIKARIEKFKQIEKKKGYEFTRLKEQISTAGVSDYTMKKATVFRKNYMDNLEKYSHLDNYDKLIKKLQSISNPISFYEFVSQDELAGDLDYQSDEYFAQEDFNYYVQSLGIEIDEETISIEKE